MKMHWSLRTTKWLWTPLSPDEIRETMEGHTSLGIGRGSAHPEGFVLRGFDRGRRNSWRPVVTARVVPGRTGSAVELQLAPAQLVFWFTLIHSFFLFGIAWLMGVVAFSSEVDTITTHVATLLDGEILDVDELGARLTVSNPEVPGAEAGAPLQVRSVSQPERARFRLAHASRLASLVRNTTALEVHAGGIEVDGVPTSWEQLDEIRVEAGRFRLQRSHGEALEVHTTAPEADLIWLRTYLEACRQRYAVPEQEVRNIQEYARRATERVDQ